MLNPLSYIVFFLVGFSITHYACAPGRDSPGQVEHQTVVEEPLDQAIADAKQCRKACLEVGLYPMGTSEGRCWCRTDRMTPERARRTFAWPQ
jgi:hypothetical protein